MLGEQVPREQILSLLEAEPSCGAFPSFRRLDVPGEVGEWRRFIPGGTLVEEGCTEKDAQAGLGKGITTCIWQLHCICVGQVSWLPGLHSGPGMLRCSNKRFEGELPSWCERAVQLCCLRNAKVGRLCAGATVGAELPALRLLCAVLSHPTQLSR